MQVIAIVVENKAGGVADITADQVGSAQAAAELINAKLHAVIIGNDIRQAAEFLAYKWGIETTGIFIPGMEYYQWDVWLDALEGVLLQMQTTGVVLGDTPIGMELAPALAVRLGMTCITGVNFIEYETGRLVFHRPLFGGKIWARVKPDSCRWVISVQAGAFQSSLKKGRKKATIHWTKVQSKPVKMRFRGLRSVTKGNAALKKAMTVIAGGRGLGKKENLKLLDELAAAIPGSVIGGSRPLCDAGWLDCALQIGLTGNIVRPKLYLACGISGAFQHIVGMRDSDFVVAINADPNAAIFNHADVAIVANVVDFLPIFTDKLRQVREDKRVSGYTCHVDHGSSKEGL